MLSTLAFVALVLGIAAYMGILWAMVMYHHEQKALQNSYDHFSDPRGNKGVRLEKKYVLDDEEDWQWHQIHDPTRDMRSAFQNDPAYSFLRENVHYSMFNND